MGKLAGFSLVAVAVACASGPPRAEDPRAGRALRCGVEDAHALDSGRPLTSVAACSAEGSARLRLPAADLSGKIKTTVVELRGPRDWREVQAALDDAELLLAVCYRRWHHRTSSDLLTVVAAIRASGAMRSVRPERDDALGQCVADVLAAVELAPDGFGRASTDVVASVSYQPSPYTQWASR